MVWTADYLFSLQALSNHRFTIYPFSNCPNYLKVKPANAWEPGDSAQSRFKAIGVLGNVVVRAWRGAETVVSRDSECSGGSQY